VPRRAIDRVHQTAVFHCLRRTHSLERIDDFIGGGRAADARHVHDIVDRQDTFEVTVPIHHRQAPHPALTMPGAQRLVSTLGATTTMPSRMFNSCLRPDVFNFAA
jgi:hypothetical protein